MKKIYYRTTNIDKTNAQYRILLGQRSNGKSYAVKEKCLMKAYRDEGLFIYMRRYQFDCKTSDIAAYFADMPIRSITNGEYEGISVYRGEIFFCNYDENRKEIRGKLAGRAVYLSGLEHFKSQAFPDITDVIYEEFVTNRMYLPEEPRMLMQFISTIARDRDITVWMIGNTISRVCPYFEEWQLRNIPKQKQGTIDIYEFARTDSNGNEYITKIAVENCENSGSSSKMFFGKSAESITSGTWETKDMPHLPRPKNDYVMLYELLLSDLGFSFVMQLLVNAEGGMLVYVYPFTGKRNIKRKISNIFSDDPLTTSCFNDKINAERLMRDLISKRKICYSDNLTGGDFEQVISNRKGVL